MHDVFAQRVWEALGWRRMGRAGLHFVRGSDAQQFAKGKQIKHRMCPGSELGPFIDLVCSISVNSSDEAT